ncbi:MAG: molecular chaperone HtpG [Gammaproteobacteria bacterium]
MPAKPAKPAKPAAETRAFQTEVQQLLHLIIHSLYGNKEIFLRELISNASDACDRLRFSALTDKALHEDDDAPGIWVEVKDGAVIVRDNGIGMSRDEVIENIGTIARSGTRAFLENMSQEESRDSAFIGQFGVGFYSAFLAAKRVTLLTRRAGAPAADAVKWVSDGGGEYALENITRRERGTEIIMQVRREQKEFLETARLRAIIAKYSEHISLPIHMRAAGGDDDDAKGEWETVNRGSALWARPKREISAEEHHAFYTALTYDPEPPAAVLHNRVEGKMEYISLFYIPAKAPFDLWERERRHAIKLYVRRIFIAEDARQLMPNYLRFVRGLVDSADLPLNVSREFLQQHDGIDKIRAASVKKVLAEFAKIAATDADRYAALWKEYGRVLKEGMVEDADNKDALAKLLRFASTHRADDAQDVSLDDYIARMPMAQKAVYYQTADSPAAARSSPHLEVFRKNDIEALLLSDPVDEWVVAHLPEYGGKPLQSTAKGDLNLSELPGMRAAQTPQETLQPLLDKIKTALGGRVKDVRLSARLVDSPSCLVADERDIGANMARILQAMGQDAPSIKPILEINPQHAIVKRIDAAGADADEWAHVLFDQAALAEGAALKNPGDYVRRVNKLLAG